MKPFKPPSLIANRPTIASQHSEINQGPAKRRRIDTEADHKSIAVPDSPPACVISKPIASQLPQQRTPLRPIAATNGSQPPGNEADSPKYFNVLWRRPTTKKNKTWDGDGILAHINGFANLEDASGKLLGRIPYKQTLDIGSQLKIAGREIEVDSVISKQDAISGRRFLGKAQSQTSKPLPASSTVLSSNTPKPRNDLATLCKATLGSSKTTNGDFKLPMARMANPAGDGKTPVPRHDPDAPGALVMKRPKSIPRGKHLVDVVVDPLLTKHLREHQRAGVAFLYECVMGYKSYSGEGAILADEMGLGKTLQTIALLWTLLKQSPIHEDQPVIKKALIVCPVTLLNNWRKEFHKWLGRERLGVLVADEKQTRIDHFTRGKTYSVMIIGYERLRSVKEELQKGDIDIVIADEGHRLKTAKNKSADAIKSLATERRVILSGTPIQNDLEEFYQMVDFCNPNLLGKYSVFKREFEIPILKSQQPGASEKELEKGEARSQELADTTNLFILRRTADILSKYLPPRTEYVVFCRPTPSQTTVYKSIIKSPIFSAALGSSSLALELINVLKKVCNAPSLLLSKGDNEDATRKEMFEGVPLHLLKSPGSSGKLQVLDSLLHKIRTTTNEKVVLVSNYTSTLDVLSRLLHSLEYPHLRLDGSTPASKRQGLVDQFNRSSANNFFVFLLSAKAGGVGLNLIGASRLILFDIDWNPATDLQAMARIHRDGQKKPCYIYRMLTKGALDEKIFQRQVSKTGLSDSIVDGKSSASSFTKEELRDLFTLDESDDCQTHKLLGCTCERNGLAIPELADKPVVKAKAETVPCTESGGADGIEILHLEDSPNDYVSSTAICSSFTSGTSVNMEAQEEELRGKGRHSKDSNGRAKMLGLMQYLHLDSSELRKKPDDEDEQDDIDGVVESALQSVIEEDGERVDFVFIKKNIHTAIKAEP